MFTFKKSERLCNFYHKERLFSEGKRLFVSPFAVVYLALPKNDPIFLSPNKCIEETKSRKNLSTFPYPCKVMITAPKRLFKNATRRNRVRRLVKESYRKNKFPLYAFLEENKLNCLLSVVYSSPNILHLGKMEGRMDDCISKLIKSISGSLIDNNC